MKCNRSIYEIVKRPLSSKKYDYGHLLIIGGSRHYTGAPTLNALGAYIAGVDVVTIAAPERAANAAAHYSPDLIAYPLKGDVLGTSHFAEISSIITRNVSAVLIGSGMGRDSKSFSLVARLRSAHNRLPFIFDADVLYSPSLGCLSRNDLLMPSVKEFAAISGNKVPSRTTVKEAALSLGCTILAKGPVDYVSDGKRTKEVKDTSGNAVYLAKGGTGDILAGVCASLVAQGVAPFDAACAGASAVKKAGAALGRKKGPFHLPSELLEALPEALLAEGQIGK